MSRGERLESLHVLPDRVEQMVVKTDGAILGNAGDEAYFLLFYHVMTGLSVSGTWLLFIFHSCG